MVAVNFSPPGLFDKAALEGMACGVPILVSNLAFAPLLNGDSRLLTSWPLNEAEITTQLEILLSLSVEERQAIGTHLRTQVIEQHSLKALMQRLISILETGEP
jgi:glycosyltransferase involved in cell wall biosynthesis